LGYGETRWASLTFGPEPVLNAFFNQEAPDNMKNITRLWLQLCLPEIHVGDGPVPACEYASDSSLFQLPGNKGCRWITSRHRRALPACPAQGQHVQELSAVSAADFMLAKLFPADLSLTGSLTRLDR